MNLCFDYFAFLLSYCLYVFDVTNIIQFISSLDLIDVESIGG